MRQRAGILDSVRDDARRLAGTLGGRDRGSWRSTSMVSGASRSGSSRSTRESRILGLGLSELPAGVPGSYRSISN